MTEPRAQEMVVARVYDAPRERVWRAWTEPEQLARWWGKRGWSTPPESVTMDVRPGGAFRLTSVNDADGREMRSEWVYREVLEPVRLVSGGAEGEEDRVATVTFADLGDGRTEMVFHTTVEMTDATRRAAEGGLGSAFELVWGIFRWPIAFLAVILFFSIVYYLAPNVEVRSWKWLSPGALVGSVSWLILSGLFSLYTSLSDSYSKTYGALASGIVLLLWLNYSAFALLFGAELNSELDRQADIHAAGGPNAGLTRPARRSR